ncbi:TetR/AcrR family transcriptional regulator [Thermomonospora amylolytica]|uniref:TetR/AcrR family transcriptional regulator n=1 Tax=Thermomonospora amylolytica TaxID=1411117 RepID=UPI000E6B62DE|nr:TetR/AcrR family transcriptional regulator [Thermomonospora amylolytica]
MTSIRHKNTNVDAVLDAARDCVLAVGVRRTTLTDIARRAGVSRMTLYRRWPDARRILADLMTRELTEIAGAVAAEAGPDGTARDRLVRALVAGVRAVRSHPLLRKTMEVDSDLLVPYLLQRRGASQNAFLRYLEGAIAAGHEDGSIRGGDPARQARSMLLVAQSFALSAPIMADDGHPLDAFDDELRDILERALTP